MNKKKHEQESPKNVKNKITKIIGVISSNFIERKFFFKKIQNVAKKRFFELFHRIVESLKKFKVVYVPANQLKIPKFTNKTDCLSHVMSNFEIVSRVNSTSVYFNKFRQVDSLRTVY